MWGVAGAVWLPGSPRSTGGAGSGRPLIHQGVGFRHLALTIRRSGVEPRPAVHLWGHDVLAANRELASRDLRLREKHLGFGCVEQPKGGFTGGWGESGDGGRYDGTACGATHLASGEHDSSMVSSART